MSELRIAVASPNRNAWSETFIAAHLDRLAKVELVLTHGRPPTHDGDGKPLQAATLSARAMHRFKRSVLGQAPDEQTRRVIAELLKRKGIDVLLAEYGNTGEALLASCRRAGVPLVVHFHGYDAHDRAVVERNGGYARIFAEAAAVVAVSRPMEQHLLALGASREKLHYNCYGIDVDQFAGGRPDLAPPHFLSVGRFVAKKAPQLTLMAFREALKEHPSATLTMVGDGVFREACQQLVRAFGMEASVTIAGVKTPVEVAELMKRSRAFVQHSVTSASGDQEGTPLAVLEAMASGLPVVSTRHAGIADVVSGERGLLVDEFDLAGMARNMLRLANEPATARGMGEAGRAHVREHHRVEQSIAALQAILENAAGRKSSGG